MQDQMEDIFIGRQPICDRNLDVYAYELLFRSAHSQAANVSDGDQATSQVIVNTFMEIGLDNIVSNRLAFINLTRNFFTDEHAISLPQERVVLELLEDIEADAAVIEGVKRLSERGYVIALDDFIYHESLKPLVALANIVKIDIMALDRDQIREHVRELRQYPLRLLAEKVESQEEFEFCKDLGFDYFQGYFFAHPKVIQGQRLPSNRLATLHLLSRLQDPDISPRDLEELISRDVSFSYRILRYVNSAALAMNKIESIRQAVVILGLRTIKSWTSLLALSQVDDKPAELVVTTMVRAKMAEGLAKARKARNPETYFTVGLFSALDALMDNSMEELLIQLPLAEHITNALLRFEGEHGEILKCVLAYERGEWEHVICANLSQAQISDCYLAAVQWANEISRQLVS